MNEGCARESESTRKKMTRLALYGRVVRYLRVFTIGYLPTLYTLDTYRTMLLEKHGTRDSRCRSQVATDS